MPTLTVYAFICTSIAPRLSLFWLRVYVSVCVCVCDSTYYDTIVIDKKILIYRIVVARAVFA